MLLGFGAFFLFLMARSIRTYLDLRQSRNWPSVTGKILRSEVSRQKTKSDDLFCPDISYEYEINEKKYVGNRLRIIPLDVLDEDEIQEEIERFPLGKEVSVYYDPELPERSVLTPGDEKEALTGIRFSLLILIIITISIMFLLQYV
ncbi:MAG: DUF3592 domain-containing protein [Planctomycetaceae bacterium]